MDLPDYLEFLFTCALMQMYFEGENKLRHCGFTPTTGPDDLQGDFQMISLQL